ncbi:MAG: GlsB/YeaQ/YmgE family stress response membrane protein [Novosphingobium sp.]
MLNIIGAIVGGLFVGALARFFYPGEVPMGWGMTILLGVGGSLLAGLIASSRSAGGIGEGISRAGCLASVLGGMALILAGRMLEWG